MYLDTITKKEGDKVYRSYLLRESYRENGKVKKRTIGSLSRCSEQQVDIIRQVLKNREKGSNQSLASIELEQGKSVGALWVLHDIAERLGIRRALGNSHKGCLSLWLVLARVLKQGSRLSAVRLNRMYAFSEILQPKQNVNEDEMYRALSWLSKNQSKIEQELFRGVPERKADRCFMWYDVTSSYFEGDQNALAAYGYNRDGKKRKKQVVVGMLCTESGHPTSVECFPGNTQDTETLQSQLKKAQTMFNTRSVTFVADRGLIRQKQIRLLEDQDCYYITGLTLPQLKALVKTESLALEDFSSDLKSVIIDGRRHLYRKNPERANETAADRRSRYDTAQRKVDEENEYLKNSPRAGTKAAKARLERWLSRLCISEWTRVGVKQRTFHLETDEEKLNERSKYDGCYVWITNHSEKTLSNREVYQSYKGLQDVEKGFRTLKMSFLEVRPIYVRSELSTRGHLFITMLAYQIVRYLEDAWAEFDLTVQEGLDLLGQICEMRVQTNDGEHIVYVPRANSESQALLSALNIKQVPGLPTNDVCVDTRKKIGKKP